MQSRGRYKLVRKIADGGMAEIYLGLQRGVQGFERQVVLKRILGTLLAEPQFKDLMIDEAHIAMTLLHGNIAQVLDLGQAKGRYYLVLEFVDGWDLNNIINRLKHVELQLPPELALFIAAEVGRALAYAHGKKREGKPMGIVHRDVSPHNVLVSGEGEIKLTDFGIAKALTKKENTVQGVIKGKLAFMSPELASGSERDARSDLCSRGTILYLMSTGKRPFEAPTDLESLLRVQKCDFPPPEVAKPDMVPALATLIRKAMSLRPSERFQTADQMLEEIEAVQRSAFTPAGKTEFKRWLKELERRDGVLSIGRVRVPTPNPNETLELSDGDIEFEEADLGRKPTDLDLKTIPATPTATPAATATIATTAPAAGTSGSFDPLAADAVVSSSPGPLPTAPTVIDMQSASRQLAAQARQREASGTGDLVPARSSRRGLLALLLLGGGGAAAWTMRDRLTALLPSGQDPEIVVSPPAPTGANPPTATPPPVEEKPPEAPEENLVATAAPEDASVAATVETGPPDADPDAAPGELDDDNANDENRLLEAAEPDIGDKIIGEEPEDAANKPPPGKAPTATPPARPVTAARPASPAAVSVRVVSNPPGAVVRLNKRVFGRAPINLRFRPGTSYELNFIKQGYLPASKKFTASKRGKQTVSVSLKKRPASKTTTRKGFFRRLFGQ